MSIGWRVVVYLYYGASCGYVCCDYKLITLPPSPVYLFELVQVYPRFQGFLVLFQVFRRKSSNEQFVREHGNVLVVGGPLIVIWSSRQRVCATVVFPRNMLQLDVVLF